jgi:ribosomal protein S18 acetylase RimI-like enzyme
MKEFRNQGYGKELFNYTLKQIKKVEDINFIYLNACPFDHHSDNQLELSSLIKFYEKYGFKVLIQQHKNAQMFIDDKSNLKLHNNKTIVSENKTMEYYNLNNNFEIDLSY